MKLDARFHEKVTCTALLTILASPFVFKTSFQIVKLFPSLQFLNKTVYILAASLYRALNSPAGIASALHELC